MYIWSAQGKYPFCLKNVLSRFPISELPNKSRFRNNMKDTLFNNGNDKLAFFFHGLLGPLFSRILSSHGQDHQYYLHRAHSSYFWDTNTMWFDNPHKLLMITFIFNRSFEILVIFNCRLNIIRWWCDGRKWTCFQPQHEKLY